MVSGVRATPTRKFMICYMASLMPYFSDRTIILNLLFITLQVRLMERRLNEVDYSSVSPSSATTNNSSSVAELYPTHQELSVTEKDRIIRSLESEVEAQVLIFYTTYVRHSSSPE